jgi:nucleoid DNA-binding protein
MVGKTELAAVIAAATGCSGNKAEACVGAIIEKISDAVAAGDGVQLRGLGSFSREHKAAREGRNPRTGESFATPPGYRVKFTPGKQLRDRLPAA